jgi:hypothetical protein
MSRKSGPPAPVRRKKFARAVVLVSLIGGLAGTANSLILARILDSISYLAFFALLEGAIGFLFGLGAGLVGASLGKILTLIKVQDAVIKLLSVISGTVGFGVLWWFSALTFIPEVQLACIAVGLCGAVVFATVFWVAWPRSARVEA